MKAVTLWLLISLGGASNTSTGRPFTKIDEFMSMDECVRVQQVLSNTRPVGAKGVSLMCVQASVARHY